MPLPAGLQALDLASEHRKHAQNTSLGRHAPGNLQGDAPRAVLERAVVPITGDDPRCGAGRIRADERGLRQRSHVVVLPRHAISWIPRSKNTPFVHAKASATTSARGVLLLNDEANTPTLVTNTTCVAVRIQP